MQPIMWDKNWVEIIVLWSSDNKLVKLVLADDEQIES